MCFFLRKKPVINKYHICSFYIQHNKKFMKLRFGSLMFFCFIYAWSIGQGFYDQNSIQKIEITFAQSNWDYMLDTAKNGSEGYLLAPLCKVNGVPYDSVGVKYKGNSSYNQNNMKNPLHIELDYVHGYADYDGYTDIKLSNGKSDPSFIREALSYQILKNYMHCPVANWAQVYINGQLYGLYTNVESINKAFIDEHFQVSNKTIVKCNPKNAGPGGSTSNLSYPGTDSTLYYNRYEIKSDWGWLDLLHLTDTLNNQSASLDKVLDIDRAIWMIAFNNVMVNLDSYTGAFAQNYYLAMDNNHRFNSIVWDLNMSFGGFPMPGSGSPLSVTQMQSMSPLQEANNAARPLIQKILANPMYKKMYIAHMKTILNENFTNGSYVTGAQAMMAIVDTAVQSDPYKFYTYQNFLNSLSTDLGGGGGGGGGFSIPGIQKLMDARATYLNGTTEFSQTAPVISNINATSPVINGTVIVTAQVTSPTYVQLGYRYKLTDKFTYSQMFDDGLHQDGAAGDGIYGGSFTMSAPVVQYYLYAENGNAGIFSPERAEHEFYTIQAAAAPVNYHEIVLNELMATNLTTVQDPAGQFADWIELYNNTSSAIDLSGIYLSDNSANLQKWYFPLYTTIPANGFLIVWADEDILETGLHAAFKLSSGGEKIFLSNTNGAILDSVTLPAAVADMSYERYPNGTGNFTVMTPTFNAVNLLTDIDNPDVESFIAFPNPTNGLLNIRFSGSSDCKSLTLRNALGQTLETILKDNDNLSETDLSHYPSGLYFLQADSGGKVFKLIKD